MAVPSFAEDAVHICDDGAEYAPYVYYERVDGKPNADKLTGATADLLQEIFKIVGLDYTYSLVPWKRCLETVETFPKEGPYEIVADAGFNEERAERYWMSTPIFRTHEGIFYSHKRFPDGPPIKTPADLNQFALCGVFGNTLSWLPEAGVPQELDYGAPDIGAALEKLSLGRCDMVLSSVEVAYGGPLIGQYTIPEDVDYIYMPGWRLQTFHFLVSRSSPRAFELVTRINQAILQLQNRGLSDDIFRKYLRDGDGI